MTSGTVPIGDYGLIGDTRTAALVSPAGSIDWCCLPRFDSAPAFGRLVGGASAGRFAVSPAEPALPGQRRYRDATTTVETSWEVDGGRLTVSDSMVADVEGRMLPATLLVRRLVAVGRPVRVRVDLCPRFGYDRQRARRIRGSPESLIVERGGLVLGVTTDAAVPVQIDREMVFDVSPTRPVTFAVSVGHRAPLTLVPPSVAATEAERDEDRWREWAHGVEAPAGYRPAVVRSLLTLRLLTYSPSGAPVAAPTTSLPEETGGSRNWDYRYAWPRDASIGIAAFLGTGKPQEALNFLAWLRHASRLARPRLPALFTLDGRPVPPERILPGWPGYAGSRPVRIGNGARSQHQLDGYGWVAEAAWLLTASGRRLDGETWRATASFADYVSSHWKLPDAGIWERRDEPRHHLHSKLMAWLTLDRAIRIADTRRAAGRAAKWGVARHELGMEIRTRGYDPRVEAYTASYGTDQLDAAVLLLPMVGLEPVDSPRIATTIDAIRAELGAGGPLLYRYTGPDGLSGGEGAFLPCSFWLVSALALSGRRDEAEDLFARLLELGGSLGLYGEEMDPATYQHLGNFPQALTHAALVQAALALGSPTAGMSP